MSSVNDIQPGQIYVIKRDGSRVEFDGSKIEKAIEKVFIEVDGADIAKSPEIQNEIQTLSKSVEGTVRGRLSGSGIAYIEDIQDQVELHLMRQSRLHIAKAYVLYRSKRNQERSLSVNLTQEQVHEQRIREIISVAVEGLDRINVEAVVTEAKNGIYLGITNEQLRELVVLAARILIEDDQQYSYFAARASMGRVFEEAAQVIGTPVSSDERTFFKAYVLRAIELKQINPLLANYDLDLLAASIKPERNSQFTYLGYTTLFDRYFIHLREVRYETPQAFFMRVAMGLAMNEEDHNSWAIKFYDLLSSFDYMSSTPTLFNAGTLRPQLSSCYLTTVPDDLYGIYGALRDNAMLSKWAGGLGNDWTPVRALNSYIEGTNGKSQGVVPFLKVNNDTAVAVNQGGKRKGAICAYLETWHLDLEEFLELRKNTGDDRRRTHDMNTANWIPDEFMVRVLTDGDWTLFTPSEVPDLHDLYGEAFAVRYKNYEKMAKEMGLLHKVVKAKDLWRKMLSMLFETGHPWFTYKDACNLRSPQQHVGVIHSSNLCTEITLNTSEDEIAVCNLGSINLPQHIVDGKLDREKLARTIKLAVRMLDNVIDINFYAVPQAKTSNMKHRPIGLGLMGFQDALYKLRTSYASQEAIDFADYSMEVISFEAIKASNDLAIERGVYETFNGSLWSQGILPLDSLELLEKARPEGMFVVDRSSFLGADVWDELRQSVVSNGMRNSNVMAIAPTATISNICGVTQSIEPTFQNLYTKSNLSGEFIIVNTYLVEELRERGLWTPEIRAQLKLHEGELDKIEGIPEDLRQLFLTAFAVEPRWIIEAASRRQKWIDQAQSLNLYIGNANGKKLDMTYKMTWLYGLKTTYYLRAKGATQAEKSTVNSDALRGVKTVPASPVEAAVPVIVAPVLVAKPVMEPLITNTQPVPTTVPEESVVQDDFLGTVDAKEVPLACSLDNPDCEACQ